MRECKDCGHKHKKEELCRICDGEWGGGQCGWDRLEAGQ